MVVAKAPGLLQLSRGTLDGTLHRERRYYLQLDCPPLPARAPGFAQLAATLNFQRRPEALTIDRDRVSVAIPTRNRSRLVVDAVQSVLLQTHRVGQIVMVDDGSTPEHAARLEKLAAAHPVIELHRHTKSRGVAAARNLAIDHARGEYLLFLDDDDLLHPRLFEDGLAALESRDWDAVVFLYETFYTSTENAQIDPAPFFSNRHPLQRRAGYNPVPASFLEQRPVSAFLRCLIPINSCLVRLSSIGDCRFPESIAQGEDTYFWISLASRGCRFLADSRPYAYTRKHPDNMTRSRSRYVREIQGCYESLIATDLLLAPDDVFLAHLKLLMFKLASRQRGWAPNLRYVLSAPNSLAHEVAFWFANLKSRAALLHN
jgi:glycosyltransferase involved in cell wall biosynthesis